MKKIILFLLLLNTLAFSESKIYTGLGYGYTHEARENADTSTQKISADFLRFKAGYGSREAYSAEFSLDYITSSPKQYAFDISLIKAYDLNIYVNPFVKVGFGAGALDNRDNSSASLRYGSFNFGGGLYVPIDEHYDIELSYEYKNRSYQQTNTTDTTNATAHINLVYLGLNVRF